MANEVALAELRAIPLSASERVRVAESLADLN
jgi:hypothetical protein